MSTKIDTAMSVAPPDTDSNRCGELPVPLRNYLREDLQHEPVNYTVSMDSLFKSIQARLNPSKGIQMRRLFEMKAIARSETSLEFYSQPRQLCDRRRFWGKDIVPYWRILKKRRIPNEKILIKMNPRSFSVDPFKTCKKFKAVRIPNIKSDMFQLQCGEEWKYSPPKPPVSLPALDDDELWESEKPSHDESLVLGLYESPQVHSFMNGKGNEIPAASLPAQSDSKSILHGNLPEFTNASKALNEVSQLLNLYFADEQMNNRTDGRLVATLITDEMPNELHDSLLKEDQITPNPNQANSSGDTNHLFQDESSLAFNSLQRRLASDAERNDKTMDTCNTAPVDENVGDHENNEKLRKREPSRPGFAIDLLEVNYRRPNVVRRRVKASTSIANWIEDNILSEFQRSKSLTSLQGRRKEKEDKNYCYKSPPKPYSNMRDFLLFKRNSKQRPMGSFMYRRISDDLQSVSSIDDFIKQQKRDPAVFHVYEALCKKTFPTAERQTESVTKSCECNVEYNSPECEEKEKPTTILWTSREEYLDNWWRQNGKYVIISQDTEDQGYFGSADDDSQKIQSMLESEQSVESVDASGLMDGDDASNLDHISHIANFDADESLSPGHDCANENELEHESCSEFVTTGNKFCSRCLGSSGGTEAYNSNFPYSSPLTTTTLNDDPMLEWIRPVSSINHSSVEQGYYWCGCRSLASCNGSVEYMWNINSVTGSGLSQTTNESMIQSKSSQEECKSQCNEKGRKKLIRYLGKVYAFCSSKLKFIS